MQLSMAVVSVEEEDAILTSTKHTLEDSYEGQNMATMIVDSTTPPKVCVDVEQAPSVVSGK